MQASAMNSKAWASLSLMVFLFLLCPFITVDAEESPSGEKPAPIYEMNGREKPTLAEEYAMQWQDIFISDLAVYSLNVKTGRVNPEDSNELIMNVRAIYKDRDLLEKLKKQYASKLEGKSIPMANEMELHFHMKEAQYAITHVAIYDQQHRLVSEGRQDAVYKKIPANSFVQAMYRLGERFMEYQKTFGKKTEKVGNRQ